MINHMINYMIKQQISTLRVKSLILKRTFNNLKTSCEKLIRSKINYQILSKLVNLLK